MSDYAQLDSGILVPTGKILLLGSFGWLLFQSSKGRFELEEGFSRVLLALLGLLFFPSIALSLDALSQSLVVHIHVLGEPDDLKRVVLEALKHASQEPGPDGQATSFNIPAVLEQAWRTGIWGVMSAVVDGVFLIASFVLECAHQVFWQLLWVMFPLGCGVSPVFPKILTNLSLYAVELSLWLPVLTLIEIATASVARGYMVKVGSWGLHVIAVEVIAILLILMIPGITHRFLSGAFSGDFETGSGIMRTARRGVAIARGSVWSG